MLAGTVSNSKSSHTSASITQKNELKVQSNDESAERSSSLVHKGRQDTLAEGKLSSDKTSDSLSASSAKGKNKKVNKIKSSKEGTIDIQSSEEISGSLTAKLKVRDNGDEINCSSSKDVKPQSTFNNMAIDVRSGKSDNTNASGPRPHVAYKPEKWMLPQQSEDTLTQLNLAIVS